MIDRKTVEHGNSMFLLNLYVFCYLIFVSVLLMKPFLHIVLLH